MHLYDTTLQPETYRAKFSEDGTVLGYVQRVPTGLGPMWEAHIKNDRGMIFLGFFYTEDEAWGLVEED